MINITLSFLQVRSIFHLLIFPSVIHHCFFIYNWSVCEDQHHFDHFSIIIEQKTFSTEDHNSKWKLNRAKWDLFNTLCTGKFTPENFKESSDPISDFTSSLTEIS